MCVCISDKGVPRFGQQNESNDDDTWQKNRSATWKPTRTTDSELDVIFDETLGLFLFLLQLLVVFIYHLSLYISSSLVFSDT